MPVPQRLARSLSVTEQLAPSSISGELRTLSIPALGRICRQPRHAAISLGGRCLSTAIPLPTCSKLFPPQ